jgi:hypothetical protein
VLELCPQLTRIVTCWVSPEIVGDLAFIRDGLMQACSKSDSDSGLDIRNSVVMMLE